ncbi:MAG TPA: helix-turn-helix domain-containing protein [Nitrososphaeraceae archaeon]|jgi:DNA-binding HxlR family transcriptional regulator
MSKIEDTVKHVNALSKKFANLSNNYRIAILAYLMWKKEATWSEIKQFLENMYGSINPNTLHFHLKALINSNMIRWSGSEERGTYFLGNMPDDISEVIRSEVTLDDSKIEIKPN